jgi:hypothetical protein
MTDLASPIAHPIVAQAARCAIDPIWSDLIRAAPAVFATLVIGLIAAMIAYNQYRVARAKLKLDLFDRRYAIFLEIWRILSEVVSQGVQRTGGLSTPFNNFIPQSAFLFGPDIEAYLNKAVSQWALLWAIQARTQGNGNIVQAADIAKQAELMRWFFEEASHGAKRIFGEYLEFKHWK